MRKLHKKCCISAQNPEKAGIEHVDLGSGTSIRDGNSNCPISADDPWRPLTTPTTLATPDEPRRPLYPDDPCTRRPLTTPDDPLTTPDDPLTTVYTTATGDLCPFWRSLGNFNNLPHIFCWAYCFVRSKGLNHVKSITMTHMLNLLLCRVEGDKFQKWLKMPMFFTCSTYWLAVGEGINEYKNDYISFCYIIYST